MESPGVYVEVALEGKNDLKILSYCYSEARNVREIASYIDLTPSTYFRKKVIARLAEQGLLQVEIVEGERRYKANNAMVFPK